MADETDANLNPDQIEVATNGHAPMSLEKRPSVAYVCKKGHRVEFDDENLPTMMELRKKGKVTHRTRPICTLCQINWNNKMFGMTKVE